MTTQEENQECEKALEGSDSLIVGRRIDPLVLSHTIQAEIKVLKQCLNYQHCGWYVGCAKDSSGNPVPGYQVKDGLCFYCNHWEELVDQIDDPQIYSIRIEGRHYQTHKNYLFRKPGKYNGFGGRKFVILMHPKDTEPNTDGHLIETHNLWTQGTIPEHFKDRLFDNATFLNEVTETVVHDGQDFITAFDVS